MERRRPLTLLAPTLLALLLAPAFAGAQETAQETASVPVETFELANGMRFLLVRRPEVTSVYAGWVAHVGSANERPGITGISHFFEHMMFKGTHTIGTKDIDEDLRIIARMEELQQKIRAEYRHQRERYRLGEIDNPFADDARPPELVALEQEFQELVDKQRSLIVKDEFDQIYTQNGGSGMNAFTTSDLTGYFVTVPANKVELWFWMESDRLANPVFREFYSERDVVYEERRLRTESTPTGEFEELFEAMFWQSHPYSWPVVGWPSDLESYTLAQAHQYFDTYYAPNNLTAALVGNFDTAEVKALAERYFGRLHHGEHEPPDVLTLEVEQRAEKRMRAECDCQPQIEVRYHSVPFRHRDSYTFEVLAGLLNGRTGRLYKSLVLDQQIASEARASQDSRKWAGAFSFTAETKGDATPEALEAAWYEELRRLRDEPIPAEELQKVKNQITADALRRLQNPFFLLIQLIFYDGLGDWTYLNTWAEKTLAVTEDDVHRVAEQYFKPENRAVALYFRKAGSQAEEVPAELAELPAQMRQAIQAQVKKLEEIEDPAQLEAILEQMEAHKAQMAGAPPEMVRAGEYMERVLRERLAELRGKAEAQEGAGEGGER